MKKVVFILVLFVVAGSVYAEEVGMEVSVFVPEALYLYEDGTVALTSGLSTSIGIGDNIEIPVGFDYSKFHGYMVQGASVDGAAVVPTKPWFIADNFLPYVKLLFKLDLGPVVLSAFGGGALSWNATLTPLEGWAADDVAAAGNYAAFTTFEASAPFGYGWIAGAEIGIKIDPVTINISAEYRDIYNPLTLGATYLTGPSTGLVTQKSLDAANAFLIMRGFACGIGGSFAF